MLIYLPWSQFKLQIKIPGKVRYIDRDTFYYITYTDSAGTFETSILQDNGVDHVNFDTNFKLIANSSID